MFSSLLLLSEDRGIESENLAVILEAVRFVEPVVETERKEEGGEDRKTEERKKKQSGSDGRFVRAAGVRLNENKPTSHITHWEVGEAHRLYTFVSAAQRTNKRRIQIEIINGFVSRV